MPPPVGRVSVSRSPQGGGTPPPTPPHPRGGALRPGGGGGGRGGGAPPPGAPPLRGARALAAAAARAHMALVGGDARVELTTDEVAGVGGDDRKLEHERSFRLVPTDEDGAPGRSTRGRRDRTGGAPSPPGGRRTRAAGPRRGPSPRGAGRRWSGRASPPRPAG